MKQNVYFLQIDWYFCKKFTFENLTCKILRAANLSRKKTELCSENSTFENQDPRDVDCDMQFNSYVDTNGGYCYKLHLRGDATLLFDAYSVISATMFSVTIGFIATSSAMSSYVKGSKLDLQPQRSAQLQQLIPTESQKRYKIYSIPAGNITARAPKASKIRPATNSHESSPASPSQKYRDD
jgi:hypothetical protein